MEARFLKRAKMFHELYSEEENNETQTGSQQELQEQTDAASA